MDKLYYLCSRNFLLFSVDGDEKWIKRQQQELDHGDISQLGPETHVTVLFSYFYCSGSYWDTVFYWGTYWDTVFCSGLSGTWFSIGGLTGTQFCVQGQTRTRFSVQGLGGTQFSVQGLTGTRFSIGGLTGTHFFIGVLTGTWFSVRGLTGTRFSVRGLTGTRFSALGLTGTRFSIGGLTGTRPLDPRVVEDRDRPGVHRHARVLISRVALPGEEQLAGEGLRETRPHCLEENTQIVTNTHGSSQPPWTKLSGSHSVKTPSRLEDAS